MMVLLSKTRIFLCKKILSDFQGRINRKKYTLLLVMYIFVVLIVKLILSSLVYTDNNSIHDYSIYNIFLVYIFYQYSSIICKRLHDLDVSGWWCMWYFLFPPIQIALCFFKGTPGPNRYGQPPEY